MKRSRTISLTLMISLLLCLVSLPMTAKAAPPRFRADSGVITLGANHVLRITFNGLDGNDTIRVRMRWMQYAPQGCSGMPAVCRHLIVAQGVTPVETLESDDAVSVDVPATGGGVRAVVESNNSRTRALAIVFDTSTQRIISMVIMANTEGD